MTMQLSAYARDAGFQIAWAIARRMAVVPRPGFELAFQAQVQREVGDDPRSLGRVNNNPLNLTAPSPAYWPGQTGWASGGSVTEQHTDFAVFGTLTAGVEAAAQNYLAATYAGVQRAIADGGDAIAIAEAIAASPWDSGHYPQLVDQVRELEAQNTGGTATMDPQQTYDAIAPIIQEKVVAPFTDDVNAIKGVLAQQAAAIATLVGALHDGGDHVNDAELADIITKIGVGLEKIGASVKGGEPVGP
jgi:hypothetical protein